jgi:hypothetical protein
VELAESAIRNVLDSSQCEDYRFKFIVQCDVDPSLERKRSTIAAVTVATVSKGPAHQNGRE